MKIALSVKMTLFLVFCLVCVTGAFGQASAYMGSTYVAPTHPMHAAPEPMGQVQSLFTGGGVTMAQGELPLWEVVPEKKEVPLGDTARQEKKEHATVKKARVVWEN